MKLRNLGLLGLCLGLIACQPGGETSPGRLLPDAAEPAAPATIGGDVESSMSGVPEAVRLFDTYCYATNANQNQIVRLAEAMKLKTAPDELKEIMSSGRGDQAQAFLVSVDHSANKFMVVGGADTGTCSFYAGGHNADAIEAALKQQFKLFQIAEDQVGLQIMTMHIPDGQANRVSETHLKGLITILRHKPNTGGDDGILISFIPPEVVKATIQ